MKSGIYASTKVATMARQEVVALGISSMQMQHKILGALARVPLCEMYLADMECSIPRPKWVVTSEFDLGALARGEATYEQKCRVYSMAPQHKSQLLTELLNWWMTAHADAVSFLAASTRRAAA